MKICSNLHWRMKMWRTQFSSMLRNEDEFLPHLLKMKNAFWKKLKTEDLKSPVKYVKKMKTTSCAGSPYHICMLTKKTLKGSLKFPHNSVPFVCFFRIFTPAIYPIFLALHIERELQGIPPELYSTSWHLFRWHYTISIQLLWWRQSWKTIKLVSEKWFCLAIDTCKFSKQTLH